MSESREGAPAWRVDLGAVLVGHGIARFRDPKFSDSPLPPSLALVATPMPLGPASLSECRARPHFRDEDGKHIVRLEIEAGTSLYGTGEIAGPLLRNGRQTVAWNADTFLYTDQTEGMYQSHPWVLGVRADGSAFGVLVDSTWRVRMDLRTGVEMRCEGHAPAVYVIDRASPQDVLKGLAELTGTMPLPPRWALGYHQCRWSYESETRVAALAQEFRRRRIPCDCIWMDIDYMDGFRCFTFDPHRFPDPNRLAEFLHENGFRGVWMIDPGIKVDPSYDVYASGRAEGHFVTTAAGEEYHGQVWPGASAFPDFTREETRRWWADLYAPFLAKGVDGVWNDMNEPAVFDNHFKQVPEDLQHRADGQLGGPGPHARYHNVYGMLMVRASREGMEKARPHLRPFILTRSNYLGGHRYAATWTGDNESSWPHLRWSIPMILNLGLSGQPFSGPDIGGFFGHCSPELFARWMGVGSLLPFARAHSIKDSPDHEPWSFGQETERVCRLAMERRYRLLPYLYTLFHEASRTGLPVARPAFFADPADPLLREADDSFLLGADVLVRCSVEPGGMCRSVRPRGIWRSFEIVDEPHPALPELHIRGGAIVPCGPVMQHTGERPLDPLTLLVSLDANGSAIGTLYEDAGDGHAHREGEYLLSTYRAQARDGAVAVRLESSEGRMARPARRLEVRVILGEGRCADAIGRDGEEVIVRLPSRGPDRRERNGDAGHLPASAFPGLGGGLGDLARVTQAQSRSISAENPDGRKSGGALATPTEDPQTSPASRALGKGWKVRPCLRNLDAGQTAVLADVTGPGVIRHIWCTVLHECHRWINLRVYYDGHEQPSINCPLGDFFANGLDGSALVDSAVISVNPKGGMNSYWPMPFRRRVRIEISNDGPKPIPEFFYQVSYTLEPVPDDAGVLHAQWRRTLTSREHPEHIILDRARGQGHYAGTYLVWTQLSNAWWGEGEVKFFIDDDPRDAPTICGTGTEDYFGGAWGFVQDHAADMRPTTYSGLYLGYPQAVYGATPKRGPIVPAHALYRWHIPDPIRFHQDLRVTVQALGWWPNGEYQPLTDDIASVAYWYQLSPMGQPPLPPITARFPR